MFLFIENQSNTFRKNNVYLHVVINNILIHICIVFDLSISMIDITYSYHFYRSIYNIIIKILITSFDNFTVIIRLLPS